VQAALLRNKRETDELIVETLHHQSLCYSKTRQFQAREEQLLSIEKYFAGSAVKQPLVVFGESGCGKTSIVAKAAVILCKHHYPATTPEAKEDAGPRPFIVVRLLGTTASSGDAPSLITHLCQARARNPLTDARAHTYTHSHACTPPQHTHLRAHARTNIVHTLCKIGACSSLREERSHPRQKSFERA
jgi:hypothetical protein